MPVRSSAVALLACLVVGTQIVFGNEKPALILKGHEGSVTLLAFAPQATSLIATAGVDKTVRLWDTKTGKEIAKLPKDLSDDEPRSVSWSPSGKALVVAFSGPGFRQTTVYYDLSQPDRPQKKTILQNTGTSIAFLPDGKAFMANVLYDVGPAGPVKRPKFSVPRLQDDDPFCSLIPYATFAAPDATRFATAVQERIGEKVTGQFLRFWNPAGEIETSVKLDDSTPVVTGHFPVADSFLAILQNGSLKRWEFTRQGKAVSKDPPAWTDLQGVPHTFVLGVGSPSGLGTIHHLDENHFRAFVWRIEKETIKRVAATESIERPRGDLRFAFAPAGNAIAVTTGKNEIEVYPVRQD